MQRSKSITVDDLSKGLQRVAYKGWLDRTYNATVTTYKKKLNSKLPPRNNVASALEYVNKRWCLGIEYLGFEHLSEDARACILYDLANIPLAMVISRLQSEGAVLAV